MTTPANPDAPLCVAVILTYNGGMAALRCVESLRASACAGLEVLVVDNASSDGTPRRLREAFPDLELLESPRNLGFGAGCNLGIEAALARGADYVLLLNQDTTIAADAVGELVDFMQAHPRAGVCGAKTLSMDPMPDGRPRLLYAGSFRHGLPLRQRVPGIERADPGDLVEPLEVDFVWGHGMLLRAAALREVGLFDPAFFMYWEDLDLCRRLSAAGHEIWCVPRAVIWHDVADGARALDSEYWRWCWKARSMAIYHRKHCGRWRAPFVSALTVASEALQLLRQGHLRALRHQLGAHVACALGMQRTSVEP